MYCYLLDYVCVLYLLCSGVTNCGTPQIFTFILFVYLEFPPVYRESVLRDLSTFVIAVALNPQM